MRRLALPVLLGLVLLASLASAASAHRIARPDERQAIRDAESNWFFNHTQNIIWWYKLALPTISTVDQSWASDLSRNTGTTMQAMNVFHAVVLHMVNRKWTVYSATELLDVGGKATDPEHRLATMDCGVPTAVITDLGLDQCPTAGTPSAGTASFSSGAWYATTGRIEQSIEQTGLTYQGQHYDTLLVSCTGQGLPGGQMTDPKLGIMQPSYKQFLCSIQLSGSTISLVHIATTAGGGYTWQAIG